MIRRAAAVNLALHLLALGFAATAMRPGSHLSPLAERQAFLAQAPLGWAIGWGTWALAALGLVVFLLTVALSVGRPLATAGFVLACAGLAVDSFCDTCQALALPIAAKDPTLFAFAERALWSGGLVAANGLYSVGILTVTLGLRDLVPARVTWLGVATFAGGMVMVLAGVTLDPDHIGPGTAITMAAFFGWTVDLTLALERRATTAPAA